MKTYLTLYATDDANNKKSGPHIFAPDLASAKKHLEKLKESYHSIEIIGEMVELLEEGKGGKQILHD
jgi:hypothetical protein